MGYELDLDELEAEADSFETERARRRDDSIDYRNVYQDAATRVDLIRTLAAHRKAAGLTQTQVAERMGTTQSAISDLEGSDTDPHISTLQRYARAVGSQVRFLCSGAVRTNYLRAAQVLRFPPPSELTVESVSTHHPSRGVRLPSVPNAEVRLSG
jgi:transcriptional regulator with XRE-family HTH domain